MSPAGRDHGDSRVPAGETGHTADRNRDSVVVQAGGDVRDNVFVDAAPKTEPVISVSVAPPFGRRDPARPLRGRDRILTELTGLLEAGPSGGQSPVIVLHGLGGCGKSSIALEVADRAIHRGMDVWWVPAVDSASLGAGMRAVARRLGATEEELRYGDAPDVLWRRLHGRRRPWLLVVDNADDPDLLTAGTGQLADGRGWVRPDPSHGLVVITSREGNQDVWGSWSTRRTVDRLDDADATVVLLDHTSERAGPPEDAASLARRLDGLPLALRLAGAYLAETTDSPWADHDVIRSFAAYEAALNAGRVDMFDHDPEFTINRTWELSLDLLHKRGLPQARPLLRLLSCLADAPIAYRLLLHPDVLAESPLFPGMDGAALWRLLCALADLGLVDFNDREQDADGPAILRVHPLVRDVSRHHLKEIGQTLDHLTVASSLLCRTADVDTAGQPEWPSAWPTWQALTSHALHVFRTVAASDDPPAEVIDHCSDAAHLVARYLRARGQYALAEVEYTAVLEIQRKVLGEEHPLTLATRQSIGGLLHDRGLVDEAEREWQAVLDARRRVLGEHHRDTLFTRHGRAILLHDRGDVEEAEREWQAVLRARREVLGEDHPHTLATRLCLAGLAQRRACYPEAEAEYRSVMEAQVGVVGPEHPDTLATRHRLATLLHDRGHHEAAETEYRAVLDLRRTVLGEQHPHTLATRHRLATLLHDRGHHEAAETEYRAVLDLRRTVLGEQHPHTLATWAGLTAAIRARRRADGAHGE